MKTFFALMACYNNPLIPLETVAKDYLGLGKREANEKALRMELPFPAIRLTDSRTAPRFVRLEDLANWIDQQAKAAQQEWKQRNQL